MLKVRSARITWKSVRFERKSEIQADRLNRSQINKQPFLELTREVHEKWYCTGTVVEIHAQETTMDLYILIKTIVPFYEGDAWKIEILVRQGEEKKKKGKKRKRPLNIMLGLIHQVRPDKLLKYKVKCQ